MEAVSSIVKMTYMNTNPDNYNHGVQNVITQIGHLASGLEFMRKKKWEGPNSSGKVQRFSNNKVGIIVGHVKKEKKSSPDTRTHMDQ